jgi:hypothetical protein
MSDFFSTLTGKKLSGNGYKSNVMNSMNWTMGFCELLFGTGVMFGPQLWIQIFSAIVMLSLLAVYIYIVLYFVMRDPSRLQSERYNLEICAMNALYSDTSYNQKQLKLSSESQPKIQGSASPASSFLKPDSLKKDLTK